MYRAGLPGAGFASCLMFLVGFACYDRDTCRSICSSSSSALRLLCATARVLPFIEGIPSLHFVLWVVVHHLLRVLLHFLFVPWLLAYVLGYLFAFAPCWFLLGLCPRGP